MLALALLLQDVTVKPTAPPPPVITVAPIAPPVILPAPRDKAPAFPVQVKVMAGKQILLQDTLLVDSLNGASLMQSRSESAPETCSNQYRYYGTPTTGLSLRINRRDSSENSSLMSVTVNWSRPTQPATCTSYGSRTAMINQTVELAPGQSVRFEGDGGLIVELRR